jgi:hypothetical protein
MTRVFISWSKPRGMAVGEALNEWLPKVIQEVEPFYSPDIEKGAPWLRRITDELEGTSLGVVIVTPESASAPWLNYEAGALSKDQSVALVCTVLLDMTKSDVSGPLSDFQATRLSEVDDVFKLVSAINSRGERPLPEPRLRESFELLWPHLAEKIRAIESEPVGLDKEPKRTELDLLGEILDRVRALERAGVRVLAAGPEAPLVGKVPDLMPGYEGVGLTTADWLSVVNLAMSKNGMVDAKTGEKLSSAEIQQRLSEKEVVLRPLREAAARRSSDE